jgi:phenylalanyl-tRNA synthetase beta chain
MRRPRSDQVLPVRHPISEDHTVVRTEILPLLLETLEMNRHRELPQRIFAVGDVVRGCANERHAAAVSLHPAADFSEAYAHGEACARELGLSFTVGESQDPAFLEGRRGEVRVDGRAVATFGEIHPDVLTAFDLEHPAAALEFVVPGAPGSPGRPGTPSPDGR